jgi:hypothetical protein
VRETVYQVSQLQLAKLTTDSQKKHTVFFFARSPDAPRTTITVSAVSSVLLWFEYQHLLLLGSKLLARDDRASKGELSKLQGSNGYAPSMPLLLHRHDYCIGHDDGRTKDVQAKSWSFGRAESSASLNSA